MAIGYEYLRETLAPNTLALARPARVRPVTRVMEEGGILAIPATVAPRSREPLDHLLFALKHEGTNLQVLRQALPRMPAADLMRASQASPNSAYLRTACFLWEQFSGAQLPDVAIAAPAAHVFDPARYVTGPNVRNAKWRVNFNGLGDFRLCPTVERTAAIEAGIAADVIGQTKAFVASLGPFMADRAIAWAYLHETQESFAIERESPTEDKARAFIALLQQAHQRRTLSEDYLVELQSSVVTSPYNQDAQFRVTQNWLRGAARGAAGVTYVPPPPALVPELMDALMRFCNGVSSQVDPIVAASIASFGFVFIHPFTDGNGRLSRFLFHEALCRSGKLPDGLILPVSIAMKHNEAQYLATLQSFSKPVRELWRVQWIDEGQYAFEFTGDAGVYRYWDATRCVEFGFEMARQALDVELKQETEFLARYDHLEKTVNQRFDVRGNDLATLVQLCLANQGVVSKNRRRQFAGRVPEAVFDFLEQEARALFAKAA